MRGSKRRSKSRIEELRAELRATLRISEETEIVFAPSGTDGALFAVFLARALLGAPIDNIMMVSDETGRGIPFASIGRHFSICTALGNSVMKGEPVEGLPRGMASLGFSGRDVEGAPVDTAQIDKTVDLNGPAGDRAGRAQSFSTPWIVPGRACRARALACLEDLASCWPDSVLVLVDACQMRLTREDLNAYLARNFMVLVTGSKFFTGPAFSGALLVPKDVADRAADIADVPVGLGAYTARASWPRRWSGIRDGLPLEQNVGEWLRWEAALAEMQAYYKVPRAFRRGAVDAFNIAFSAYSDEIDGIDAAPGLSLSQGLRRSIAPFFLTRQGRRLTVDEATALYRRLNDEIALAAPGACHLGQPIAFGLGPKENAGAFRASLSARIVSDAWAAGDPTTALRQLNGEIARLGAALERVAFMASHGTLSTKKR